MKTFRSTLAFRSTFLVTFGCVWREAYVATQHGTAMIDTYTQALVSSFHHLRSRSWVFLTTFVFFADTHLCFCFCTYKLSHLLSPAKGCYDGKLGLPQVKSNQIQTKHETISQCGSQILTAPRVSGSCRVHLFVFTAIGLCRNVTCPCAAIKGQIKFQY